jgi:hypothetical protein
MSLVFNLGLGDLTSTLTSTPLAGVLNKLPGDQLGDTIELSLNGPRASCSVGPAGSGDVSATDNPAGASVNIVDSSGKSILPNGAIPVSGGDIFNQLLGALNGSPLASLLQQLSSQAPVSVTLDPNSRKYTSGSKATATAGELGLSSGGTTIFDVKAATVTCGPNTEAAVATPAPSSPSGSSPSTGSTSGEKPLSGIQTDEGRSAIPAAQSYLALNGMP